MRWKMVWIDCVKLGINQPYILVQFANKSFKLAVNTLFIGHLKKFKERMMVNTYRRHEHEYFSSMLKLCHKMYKLKVLKI